MKHRSPIAVFFLPIITFGIYGIVWQVKTKNEMNKLGAEIPTAWLLIIPIVNLYWHWKYCEGVEKVTGGQLSGVLAFVLLILLSIIGMAIIQNEFNTKVGATAAPMNPSVSAGQVPAQPATSGNPAPEQPDNTFGGPPSPPVSPQSPTPPSTT